MIVNKESRDIAFELKELIKEKQKDCKTYRELNNAVNLARKEINEKYGKGWREDLNLKEMKKIKNNVWDDKLF